MAIYPVNDSEIVEKLGRRLDADLDTLFMLTNIDGELFTVIDCSGARPVYYFSL